ncbi:hypothetical protein [Pseudoalteromonas spongiae]|uniref:hypothetical protein n=1 Tax=Pseudoalteromonas spongiae TaxID=298657 RepID=UPI000C2D0108|nr:hypothetical protein [Pseudoalteromonas spongiae]
MNKLILITCFILLPLSANSKTFDFPSYHPDFPPPPDAPKVFSLSQNYPESYEREHYPWESISFKNEPNEYIYSVLEYCLEGNLEVEFEGQNNSVRKWYHAPWLHAGGNGREYIHGLTRERGTPIFEVHRDQDVPLENWAVGLYNEPAGYTLGKVWKLKDGYPAPENASFPEGSVSCKLLFTDGNVEKVPFLKGSFEWTANIYTTSRNRAKRVNRTVRLFQIDIAVKDQRADPTGWVFGTFVYDASKPGENPWKKLVPVGLSWGDDQSVKNDLNKDGAFVNQSLKQTYLNKDLIEDLTKDYTNQAYIRYHGLGGRLNGPVDNPISSCISCHGQAATYRNYKPFNPSSGRPMPMADFSLSRQDFTEVEFDKYFSDVKSGAYVRTFNEREYINLDYSLQLAVGIRNFFENMRIQKLMSPNLLTEGEKKNLQELNKKLFIHPLPEITRGEDSKDN